MRKPRAVILDDDASIRNMFKAFFSMRGYEALPFDGPASLCAVDGCGEDFCADGNLCCDIMITDISMRGVSGVELLENQSRKGCRLDARNKAAFSGDPDEQAREPVQSLGCAYFNKPFAFSAFSDWLDGCEQRLDLSRPLSTRRRDDRRDVSSEISLCLPGSDAVSRGLALNMSSSGLCLKVVEPLEPRQRIVLLGGHFPAQREGLVRWVSRVDNGSFLTGVQYGR